MFRDVKNLWGKRPLSVTASENLPRKMLLGMTHTTGHDRAQDATSSWVSPVAQSQVCTFWDLQKVPERTFILMSEHPN